LYPDNAIDEVVTIYYLDSVDFEGVNGTESDFKVWRSFTNGYYYEDKFGLVDTSANYATTGEAINIKNATRLTVSDHICDDPPIINLADTVHICLGSSYILDAGNTGYDHLWYTNNIANVNDTSRTKTVSLNAQYKVRVTDPRGCFNYDSTVVILDSLPHSEFTTLSGGSVFCKSDSLFFTNTSTIDISGYPMNYLWEFGDGTVSTDSVTSKKYQASGTYNVTLTAYSSQGCTHKTTKPFIIKPLPNVNFDFGDACQTNGIIFTNSSSGVISSNLWNFGNGDTSTLFTPTYNYPDSGQYEITLTVSNNFNCTDSLKKTILIFAPGNADFSTSDANVCLGVPSVFHNTSSIESGSMTYKWDFGNGIKSSTANPILTYDAPGTYDVTLVATSNHGCTDTIVKSITIYPIPTSNFTFNDVCLGDTSKLINSSSISPAESLTYQWTMGDGSTATTTNINKMYSTSGNYNVKLSTTSSYGCKSSIEKTVHVYPNPTANFIAEPVCLGNFTVFQNFSFPNDGTLSYSWAFGDGSTSTQKEPEYKYSSDGSFAASLITKSIFGCSDTVSKNIDIHSLPIVDIGGGDTIPYCTSSKILDAENTGSSYLWSNNSFSQTIIVSESGNYSVTVTSSLGCSNSDNVFVMLNSPIVIDLGGSTINTCDSISLNAGYPGADYLWSTGETTRDILVTNTGNYAVTVTDHGCTGNTSSYVNVFSSTVVDLGSDITECQGSTVTIDAGSSGINYLWSTGETSQNINITNPGNYSVTVTNADGCQSSDALNIQFNPLPVMPFSEDITICGGVLLDAQDNGATYLWNNGTGNQTLYANQTGSYWVNIITANNCSVTDSINITIIPKPIVALGNDTSFCSGEILLLNAQNTGSDYLWNNGETSQTLNVTTTGNYWVSVTNNYNCSSIDTINIKVNPIPNVELGENLYLCKNQQALLDAGSSGVSYTWGSTTGFISNQSRVFVSDSGKYWVDVVNEYACKLRDSILIQHSDLSINAYFLAPTISKIGDTIQFVDVSYPTPINYLWDFKDGVTSTTALPTHIFYKEGVFNVKLFVNNAFCNDTISKPLTISGTNKYYLPEDNDSTLKAEMFEILDSQVYPNPNDGEFIYELKLNQRNLVSLYLYDLNGMLIYTENIDQTSYIFKSYDFSRLKAGIYIYKMVVKDQVKSFRIVKM